MKRSIPHLLSLISLLAGPALGAEAAAPSPDDNVPTRLVTEDVDSYIEGIRAKLAINAKDRGPFGLYQQPGKEPKKPLFSGIKRPEPVKQIPLQTMVSALPVTAVMPADRMFMVGARTFRVGNVVPLSARGRTVRAKVVSVQTSRIVFRDVTTSELAEKRLGFDRSGINPLPGSGGTIRPPGVVPDGGAVEVPLELDLGVAPEAPSQ